MKKNTNLFKELNVEDLEKWFDNNFEYMTWRVPPGHMAVIHLRKVNGQYQTVWTNLTKNEKDRGTLPMAKGGLSSLIIKMDGQMHWWVNKNLLVNIYDTLRYFKKTKKFLDKNSSWWKQVFCNPKSGRLNLQCTSRYNLKQEEIFNIMVNMNQAELYK